MKKFLSILLLIFVLSSCTKDIESVTVKRDCTGTYIEYQGQDYLVCNSDMLSSYNPNDVVELSFKDIKTCKSYVEDLNCGVFHPYIGFVKITSIK